MSYFLIRVQVVEVTEEDPRDALDVAERERENVVLSLDNVQHSGDLSRVVTFAQKVFEFVSKKAV